jgi:hypothetical protein
VTVFLRRFGRQLASLVLLAVALWILAVWMPRIASGDDGTTTTDASTPPSTAPVVTVTVTTTLFAPTPPPIVLGYAGHSAKAWHDRYLAQRARTRSLKRTLLHRPSVVEALNLACAVYGNCATLWRRARCESHLRALAANPASSARGLLQFLTTGRVRRYGDHATVNGGTCATTPFWRFDVNSPYANALAAGWMIDNGRGGEWDCR